MFVFGGQHPAWDSMAQVGTHWRYGVVVLALNQPGLSDDPTDLDFFCNFLWPFHIFTLCSIFYKHFPAHSCWQDVNNNMLMVNLSHIVQTKCCTKTSQHSHIHG